MSSKAQIAANRRNAAKSTGPRSAEGKAVSKMNALKTGIYAEQIEIDGEGDDKSKIKMLTEEYYEHFEPACPQERELLDILIHDAWLLRRFRRIEGELFVDKIERIEYYLKDGEDHDNKILGEAYFGISQALSRLQRRITETERSFNRTLENLEARLEARPAHNHAASVTPISPSLTADPQQIGFVPQNVPAATPAPQIPVPAQRKAPPQPTHGLAGPAPNSQPHAQSVLCSPAHSRFGEPGLRPRIGSRLVHGY